MGFIHKDSAAGQIVKAPKGGGHMGGQGLVKGGCGGYHNGGAPQGRQSPQRGCLKFSPVIQLRYHKGWILSGQCQGLAVDLHCVGDPIGVGQDYKNPA